MPKRVSPMNLLVAKAAVWLAKTKADPQTEKCIPLLALLAERAPKFLSSPEETGLYIAVIVSQDKDNYLLPESTNKIHLFKMYLFYFSNTINLLPLTSCHRPSGCFLSFPPCYFIKGGYSL
jgi:hypothetical protein